MTPKDLRLKYKFETGHEPGYYKKNRKYYLTGDYIIWLEEQYCKIKYDESN